MKQLILKDGQFFSIIDEKFEMEVYCNEGRIDVNITKGPTELFYTHIEIDGDYDGRLIKMFAKSSDTKIDDKIRDLIASDMCEYLQTGVFYDEKPDELELHPYFDIDHYLPKWEDQIISLIR